jgi:hypothetical protein
LKKRFARSRCSIVLSEGLDESLVRIWVQSGSRARAVSLLNRHTTGTGKIRERLQSSLDLESWSCEGD